MFADRASALALGFAVVLGIGLGTREARAQATPDYAALIAAPDRSEADREADKRRDPLPLLKFAAPRPGMKVLDMGAGGGYSTELMARAVAPNGKVYGQFPADGFQKAIDNFNARLQTPAMSDAAPDFRPCAHPVQPDVSNLDLITFLFYYHDTTYMTVDRAQMDRKMFAALKPGGFLVIADHSARAGDGTTVGKTLHRIEEGTLRKEIEAAGFKLAGEADFLRHPEDPRDAAVFHPAGPVDAFGVT